MTPFRVNIVRGCVRRFAHQPLAAFVIKNSEGKYWSRKPNVPNWYGLFSQAQVFENSIPKLVKSKGETLIEVERSPTTNRWRIKRGGKNDCTT